MPPDMDDTVKRLRKTTEEMANFCSVDMELWNRHSNACLDAANLIERLKSATSQLPFGRQVIAHVESLPSSVSPVGEGKKE